MKLDYIEIGSSDIETLHQERPNECGLTIEPIKAYLDALPDIPGKIKVNCAMSNASGTAKIYWVDPVDIEQYKYPPWLRGCNSINVPHPTTVRVLQERNLSHLLKCTSCEVMTWNMLLDQYHIESVKYVKIDAEGHDCVIVNTILDSIARIRPAVLSFEGNPLLTNHEELGRTFDRLPKCGYERTIPLKDTGDNYFENKEI